LRESIAYPHVPSWCCLGGDSFVSKALELNQPVLATWLAASGHSAAAPDDLRKGLLLSNDGARQASKETLSGKATSDARALSFYYVLRDFSCLHRRQPEIKSMFEKAFALG
jgi:hypothetical protein